MTPKPLPHAAQRLCKVAEAPPRLIAHLTLVHDTACELLDRLVLRFPLLEMDADAVRFGAATHDLGKVLLPEELDGPGSRHEELGHILLEQHGIDPSLARFARTHGEWRQSPDLPFEDLLVALADMVWRGKRDSTLEERIACKLPGEPWAMLIALDEVIAPIAEGGEARLAWQREYGIGR